jgi:hypothetical protein
MGERTVSLLPGPQARERLGWLDTSVQLLVALILMGPVLMRASTHVPGRTGLADLPGTLNLHWLVHEVGLGGVTHTRMLMYPSTVDRVVIDGFPLDALLSWPFLAVFGWPAGFTVFIFASMVALGCATAWLGRCWWGDARAAAVAGAMAQLSPFLMRELIQGRPTQVLGAIFLPLALGFLLRGMTRDSPWDAAIGGAMVGLGALCYWYYGAFFAISAALLIGVGVLDGHKVVGTIWASTVGCLVVAGVPALYAFAGLSEMPGADVRATDTLQHGGEEISLVQLLELRDLTNGIRTDGVVSLQVLGLGLVVLVLWRAPVRRWLMPLIWIGVAALLAAGPLLAFPTGGTMPGPFALFAEIPGLRRMWWPDRALVMAVPALALLVGGGLVQLVDRIPLAPMRRWGAAITVAALLAWEAQWMVPSLPMASAWAGPTVRSAAIAEGSGPALILPLGGGKVQQDAQMLIDQIHHGRPLVNGPMPPDSEAAPAPFLDFVATPSMAQFVGCETDAGRDPAVSRAVAWAALGGHGIQDVYLDTELSKRLQVGASGYRACVELLLGPAESASGPYLVYRIPK